MGMGGVCVLGWREGGTWLWPRTSTPSMAILPIINTCVSRITLVSVDLVGISALLQERPAHCRGARGQENIRMRLRGTFK